MAPFKRQREDAFPPHREWCMFRWGVMEMTSSPSWWGGRAFPDAVRRWVGIIVSCLSLRVSPPTEHLTMKIERIWAMPNKWTFTIKPIWELLDEEIVGLVADPFAGENSPAHEQNDIDEICGSSDVDHKDALVWLKGKRTGRYDTVLYDPPYSITQARSYGKKEYASMKYCADCIIFAPTVWHKQYPPHFKTSIFPKSHTTPSKTYCLSTGF